MAPPPEQAARTRQTARKSTATSHFYPPRYVVIDPRQGPVPVGPTARELGSYNRPLPNTARKSTAFYAVDPPRTRGGPAYPFPPRQGMNQQEFGRNLSKLTRKSAAWAQSATSSKKEEPEDGSCPACGWVDKPRVIEKKPKSPPKQPSPKPNSPEGQTADAKRKTDDHDEDIKPTKSVAMDTEEQDGEEEANVSLDNDDTEEEYE